MMNNSTDSFEKTIGNYNYEVRPFRAMEAIRLKSYLLKIIAPTTGRIITAFDLDEKKGVANLSDSSIDGAQLGDALEKLFSELGEDELVKLIKKILKNTSVKITDEDGKERTFFFDSTNNEKFENAMDNVFKRNILSVYKVMLFVLEVNFPDFFELVSGFGTQFQTLLSKMND
jgi:hypothetical protein